MTHEYVEANNSLHSVSWDFKWSNQENNSRLRPFICTHMVSILGRDLHPPSKFCGNPCGSFSIILLTNQPTIQQTGENKTSLLEVLKCNMTWAEKSTRISGNYVVRCAEHCSVFGINPAIPLWFIPPVIPLMQKVSPKHKITRWKNNYFIYGTHISSYTYSEIYQHLRS